MRRQAVPILAGDKDERIPGAKTFDELAIVIRRSLIHGRRADVADREERNCDASSGQAAALPTGATQVPASDHVLLEQS